MTTIAYQVQILIQQLRELRDTAYKLASFLATEVADWAYPVGIGENDWPTEKWYAASLHDVTGVLNDGYKHTGVDLNMDKSPWGDVDRGAPVYSVCGGIVHNIDYSTMYLGCVIIQAIEDGKPLFLRYWHLANDRPFLDLWTGDEIAPGQHIGNIGNYKLGAGGDHLHFDAARDVFGPHWWHTKHPEVEWIDPVPIMKRHLNPAIVDAMLKKGG